MPYLNRTKKNKKPIKTQQRTQNIRGRVRTGRKIRFINNNNPSMHKPVTNILNIPIGREYRYANTYSPEPITRDYKRTPHPKWSAKYQPHIEEKEEVEPPHVARERRRKEYANRLAKEKEIQSRSRYNPRSNNRSRIARQKRAKGTKSVLGAIAAQRQRQYNSNNSNNSNNNWN